MVFESVNATPFGLAPLVDLVAYKTNAAVFNDCGVALFAVMAASSASAEFKPIGTNVMQANKKVKRATLINFIRITPFTILR